jgi:hypothetical protein
MLDRGAGSLQLRTIDMTAIPPSASATEVDRSPAPMVSGEFMARIATVVTREVELERMLPVILDYVVDVPRLNFSCVSARDVPAAPRERIKIDAVPSA